VGAERRGCEQQIRRPDVCTWGRGTDLTTESGKQSRDGGTFTFHPVQPLDWEGLGLDAPSESPGGQCQEQRTVTAGRIENRGPRQPGFDEVIPRNEPVRPIPRREYASERRHGTFT